MGFYMNVLDNPLVVALDKAPKEKALEIIKELGRRVRGYQIGPALWAQGGVRLIDEIKSEVGTLAGSNVASVKLFLDLQLTGTPDSIGGVCAQLAPYFTDIEYLVVNAASGPAGIRRAVQSLRITKVLVGSVLDSLSTYEAKYVYGDTPEEVTLRFARIALEEGAGGICCSVSELEYLRHHYPRIFENEMFRIAVYGVRPEWHRDRGTHRVTMTPREAKERGADIFIVGAPVREARNRKRAVRRILAEVGKKTADDLATKRKS